MTDRLQTLFSAIIGDDRAQVNVLLKKDAALAREATDADDIYEPRLPHHIYTGDTALHVAAAGYRVEIAEMLLVAGAEVGAAKNKRRGQPLHYASDGCPDGPLGNAERQIAMIRLLLKAGADIHAQDKNGATPLHRAVRTRCAGVVQCLLDAGSDATIRNKPGSTPFHLAVQNTGRGGSGSEMAKAAQLEIIQAFLERGVPTSLKDANGKSVVDWAASDQIRRALTGATPKKDSPKSPKSDPKRREL
jgi:ankyrin repeat protein